MELSNPTPALSSVPGVSVTAENLAVMLASAMAMVFDHLPALRERFGALAPQHKRVWMSALLAMMVAGVAFAGCQGWLQTDVACQPDQWPRLAQVFLLAVASNQAAHLLAKPEKDRG